MSEKTTIVLVDDEENFRKVLTKELLRRGHTVCEARDGDEALEMMHREDYDIVLLDLKMPGKSGEQTLKEMKELSPLTEVVILTGHASIDSAIYCMKIGAYDYLTKPILLNELDAVLQKAKEKRDLSKENLRLKHIVQRAEETPKIIWKSKKMREVMALVEKVSSVDSPVLIQGETGTGKELIARQIHRRSPRNKYPFLVINCGALQETLLESELFGYEKGAFTGAVSRKLGLFEITDGGTLFLDEVGEISLSIQVKILRTIETGEIRRLGGMKNMKYDVRIVSTTNKNLENLIKEGKFREDLFYRLNIVTLNLPPLRERKEDIDDLLEHFLKNTKVSNRKNVKFSPLTLKLLKEYNWPGNIRELQNVVERVLIISEDDEILPSDLPIRLQMNRNELEEEFVNSDLQLKEVEKGYITRMLAKCKGNKKKTAEMLGISLRTLYNKLKEYEI